MIAIVLPLSAFKGDQIYRPTLESDMATARLPALLATATDGDRAKLYLNTDAPLSPSQRLTLDGIVARLDSPAELLGATKVSLDVQVDDHAKTLNQAAGETKGDVIATRDATKAAIDVATTVEEATAIAEAYTGRSIE